MPVRIPAAVDAASRSAVAPEAAAAGTVAIPGGVADGVGAVTWVLADEPEAGAVPRYLSHAASARTKTTISAATTERARERRTVRGG